MNYQFSQSSAALSHSLAERFLAATGEATRAALFAFQSTWRERAEQSAQANSLELMAGVNTHTLKDIGAPNWLIAHAIERQDSQQFRLLDLYRS